MLLVKIDAFIVIYRKKDPKFTSTFSLNAEISVLTLEHPLFDHDQKKFETTRKQINERELEDSRSSCIG